MLYLQIITCAADDKKNLDLTIEKLQPHKSAKFLKIFKYSISFNQ